MPATTDDHMDRAFCRLYEQLKAREEADGPDLENGAADAGGAEEASDAGQRGGADEAGGRS